MSLYEQSAAIAQMNQWGKAAKPFLFLVDYRGTQTLLLPLDEIDPDHLLYDFSGVTNTAGRPPEPLPLPLQWSVVPPTPEAYAAAFHTVVHHLKRGDSFLTNLTCRLPLTTNLSLRQMFHHASARYRLWWDDRLVCFSPEIFVQISEGKIHSFPMKGTLDAHLPNARALLLDNPKEAAEHATIVDLIRNDLSTIATEVHVARYRYVDTIATHSGALLQTSSEVVGTLPKDYPARLGTLFFRLLPAGSITGAPKPKTMDIIAAAETYERGFYTGVMGIFDGRNVDSAVMIRFVDRQPDGTLAFKAGGGITCQSDLVSEYAEVCQKAVLPLDKNFSFSRKNFHK